MKPLLTISCALTLILCTHTAHTSPLDLFGFGARGAAMGGAIATTPQGPEAVYYNPAALAMEQNPSFSLGFQRADFFLEVQGVPRKAQAAPALNLGFSVPLPLQSWLHKRLAIGLAFVLPQTSILVANIPAPGQVNFTLLENRAQIATVQGAFALRLSDRYSLGLGFLALAALQGAIDVAPNESGRLGSRVRDEVISEFSPTAGFLARPWDSWSFALTFRGESSAGFSLPINADLGEGFSLPIPLLDITGTAQYDPRQLSLEVAHQTDQWTAATGLTWKQWSRFENPIIYTAVPDDYPAQPLPNFHDTWVLRAGGELVQSWSSWRLTERAGLIWELSPVPDQTGQQNYLDNERWVTSLGLGIAHDSGLSLNLAAQAHWLVERRSVKDSNLLRDPDTNPGFPDIQHGGQIFLWGLELRVEL